jgi:pilus assembly protein Flp/PilA
MVNIMKTLSKMLTAFWQEESGLTVVEYAVAGALISLAVVAAFGGLGTAVTASIGRITAAL